MGFYQGWKIVAAGFVIATVAWGVGFYGTSVYLVALSQRHGWSVSQISTTLTAYYIASAILTSFAGDLYQRFHPAALVSAAMLALGGGLVLLGIIGQFWQLYPVFGLIVLGWSLTGGAGVYAIVGPWFDRRRGLALSIALTGASFAGVITVPSLIVHREFDDAAFTRVVGLIIAINQLVFAFGPGFLGYVRTIAGSYGPALVVCAVIQLICAAVVLLRPPVTPPSR